MPIEQKGTAHQYAHELAFTQTYQNNRDAHVAMREVECIKVRPTVFTEIEDNDLFAGRIRYGLFSFGCENITGGAGGYGFTNSNYSNAENTIEQLPSEVPDEGTRQKIIDSIRYWQQESVSLKCNDELPEELKEIFTKNGEIAHGFSRLAGVFIDFEKLMQIGLNGLLSQARDGLQRGEGTEFFTALISALEYFKEVILEYADHAKEKALTAPSPNRKEQLLTVEHSLRHIAVDKPQTLHQAMQLVWLYSLMAGVANFGRMDVYLGDFYVSDIDKNVISEEQALKLLQSLWQMIADRVYLANDRIVVGGRGRRNIENADRFALAAMEATRTVIELTPNLTLRFYEGMNPALMAKALDVIGEGRVHPMLYNDDINVDAVHTAFGIPIEHAEQYMPLGCGEYIIDHKSLSSPNCLLILPKVLEVLLHNGIDPLTGNDLGNRTGDIDNFKTFDDLWAAYAREIEFYTDILAKRHVYEYETERKRTAFLYVSALFDNCMERGRSVVDGGALYRGGELESFGIVNTGDSLAVIKKLVYEQKVFTLKELVKILDADFVGYEKERQMILDVPKYGNDDDETDSMVVKVSEHLCKSTIEAGKRAGLHHFLVVNINNRGHVDKGKSVAASADGRKSGQPLANGNTPTAGNDKSGITAFFNSIIKVDPTMHAGYVHNMKFTKQMFGKDRPKLELLLDTYFAGGGQQAMITVVDRGDLENAMKEPEKYSNLIVRVGGFCARFVELDREMQLDILSRTLY